VFLAIVGLVLLHLCKTIAIAFTTNDGRERDCVADLKIQLTNE